MRKLKITALAVLAVSALGLPAFTGAQTNEAKLAAARACYGDQWRAKGYNSYQDCTADYIHYYPELPPGQEPL